MNEEQLKLKESLKPVIPCNEQLSDEEKKLDEYLSRIKKNADIRYKDGNPYGIVEWTDEEDIDPDLYRFCQLLPKGGDLHTHDNVTISYDRFEQMVIDNMIISLDKDSFGTLYTKNSSDIPENSLCVSEALEKGIIDRKQLSDILLLKDEDGARGYWKKLEQLFTVVGDTYNDIAFLEKMYEEGFRGSYERGIDLIEVRDYGSDDDLMNIIRVRTLREAYYRAKKDCPDLVVRIIGCSGKDSSCTVEESCETLRSMIRVSEFIKDDYDPENVEEFIIGLDLVNEEDNSKPLIDFADFLTSDEVKESGLGLYLHCGESLRRDNDSVVDAYLMGSTRVGHALNLYRYPKMMDEYLKKPIPIEVCLMSNYRLNYVKDLRLHPGLIYLIFGIPIVLCSDDGLFMSRAPMVDDFYSAILCWDLELANVKEICRNSIKYSGLSEKEISRIMNNWEIKWNNFVSEILKSADS